MPRRAAKEMPLRPRFVRIGGACFAAAAPGSRLEQPSAQEMRGYLPWIDFRWSTSAAMRSFTAFSLYPSLERLKASPQIGMSGPP